MTEQLTDQSWRLVTSDGAGNENISAAVQSLEHALAWARDLISQGAKVERLQSNNRETVSYENILEWCRSHRA